MSTEGTERRLSALSPVAWWCPRCESPDYIGEPEDGCTGCGWRWEA